jgi:hypothetical protein
MIAPMLIVLNVLENLLSNDDFDSVSFELMYGTTLILRHTCMSFYSEHTLNLEDVPEALDERETYLITWVMDVNMRAKAILAQQEMPEGTTIH